MDIDPQLQERLMLYGGLIPGAIAMLALLSVWYAHAFFKSKAGEDVRDDESETKGASVGPRWALPILLAIGFVGADYASNEVLHLWPEGNNYRFTHAIVLITLAAVAEGLFTIPLLLGFVIRMLAYSGAFWMLSEGYETSVFGDSATLIGSMLFAGIAAAVVSIASDRVSEDTRGWVDSITWLVIAGATMPILLYNHFSIGAMIPAGIIAVLVSTLLVSLIFRDIRFARGGVTVLVGFMLTMLAGSIVQTGVENLPAVMLLAIAPMVTLVPMKGVSGIRQLVARLILLAVILGSSGGLMYMSHVDEGSSSETDPYADYE
jgi:hypothetical protein